MDLAREVRHYLLPARRHLATILDQTESLDLSLKQLMVFLHCIRFFLHDALSKSILLLVVPAKLR